VLAVDLPSCGMEKIALGTKAPASFVLWPYLAQVSPLADWVMTLFSSGSVIVGVSLWPKVDTQARASPDCARLDRGGVVFAQGLVLPHVEGIVVGPGTQGIIRKGSLTPIGLSVSSRGFGIPERACHGDLALLVLGP
jgi:hypothetical protein